MWILQQRPASQKNFGKTDFPASISNTRVSRLWKNVLRCALHVHGDDQRSRRAFTSPWESSLFAVAAAKEIPTEQSYFMTHIIEIWHICIYSPKFQNWRETKQFRSFIFMHRKKWKKKFCFNGSMVWWTRHAFVSVRIHSSTVLAGNCFLQGLAELSLSSFSPLCTILRSSWSYSAPQLAPSSIWTFRAFETSSGCCQRCECERLLQNCSHLVFRLSVY